MVRKRSQNALTTRLGNSRAWRYPSNHFTLEQLSRFRRIIKKKLFKESKAPLVLNFSKVTYRVFSALIVYYRYKKIKKYFKKLPCKYLWPRRVRRRTWNKFIPFLITKIPEKFYLTKKIRSKNARRRYFFGKKIAYQFKKRKRNRKKYMQVRPLPNLPRKGTISSQKVAIKPSRPQLKKKNPPRVYKKKVYMKFNRHNTMSGNRSVIFKKNYKHPFVHHPKPATGLLKKKPTKPLNGMPRRHFSKKIEVYYKNLLKRNQKKQLNLNKLKRYKGFVNKKKIIKIFAKKFNFMPKQFIPTRLNKGMKKQYNLAHVAKSLAMAQPWTKPEKICVTKYQARLKTNKILKLHRHKLNFSKNNFFFKEWKPKVAFLFRHEFFKNWGLNKNELVEKQKKSTHEVDTFTRKVFFRKGNKIKLCYFSKNKQNKQKIKYKKKNWIAHKGFFSPLSKGKKIFKIAPLKKKRRSLKFNLLKTEFNYDFKMLKAGLANLVIELYQAAIIYEKENLKNLLKYLKGAPNRRNYRKIKRRFRKGCKKRFKYLLRSYFNKLQVLAQYHKFCMKALNSKRNNFKEFTSLKMRRFTRLKKKRTWHKLIVNRDSFYRLFQYVIKLNYLVYLKSYQDMFKNLRALRAHCSIMWRRSKWYKKKMRQAYPWALLKNTIEIIGLSLILWNGELLANYIALMLKRLRKKRMNLLFINTIREVLIGFRRFYPAHCMRIGLFGKLSGKHRTQTTYLTSDWIVPLNLSRISQRMEYCQKHCPNLFGVMGIKIWIFIR